MQPTLSSSLVVVVAKKKPFSLPRDCYSSIAIAAALKRTRKVSSAFGSLPDFDHPREGCWALPRRFKKATLGRKEARSS